MGYPPVVVVDSGGVPRTQVDEGGSAPPFTVVASGARPITLAPNAPPIQLFNPDGTPYNRNPFRATESILGAGGLDYALYDSSALDRMWQEATGQTPANANSPVGLIVGREKQGAKTFAQVMAGQAELRGIGLPAASGTPPAPANYNPASGVGSAARTDVSNTSFVSFNVTAAKQFLCDVQNTGSTTMTVRNARGGSVTVIILPGERKACLIVPAVSTLSVEPASNGETIAFTVHSIKEVPAHYASQTVGGSRPSLQADGLKFDGSDDNLLTDWFAQAGANCIIAQVTVPAALSTSQVIGGSNTVTTSRFYLGVGTAGQLIGGAGDLSPSAAIDLRGAVAVLALTMSSAEAKMFANAAEVYSQAKTGDPITSNPVRLGAGNQAGNPGSFFAGSIKRIAFGKTALTLEQFQQIRAEWLAAA